MTLQLVAGRRLAVTELERLLLGKDISPRVALALKLHLCEGIQVVQACKRAGVSRPGFYRARKALDVGPTPPEHAELCFQVPVHRAELLNAMISRQLEIWATEDAATAVRAAQALREAHGYQASA